MTMRFFIFGAGYSGCALARELAGDAAASVVGGTTRTEAGFARLQASGITPFLFGGDQVLSPDITKALATTTHLVVSIGPDEAGDPVIENAGTIIAGAMPALKWIGYLSTVGVYGDHDGAWVNETSACHPVSKRSKMRLEAEKAWAELGEKMGLPVAILRLSGIYGPARNAFSNLSQGKARRIVKPGQVFNRVHVDDIAGACAHLARRREGGIFNITDDAPSPPQDVVEHAARLMGIAPPPEIPFEEAGLSPMGRSFYGECKRAANAKLKKAGYTLRHPDYRTALASMWAEKTWQSERF